MSDDLKSQNQSLMDRLKMYDDLGQSALMDKIIDLELELEEYKQINFADKMEELEQENLTLRGIIHQLRKQTEGYSD